ncbi:MAG: DNA primase [Rubrivivax sp.]
MGARGQIPDSFIQEVLSRTDIVEVVSRHVALRRGGANLLGLCPFHGEKSPSFTVSPAKQFYHCFGCGAHGDAIRFLMEHAGMGFVDAVRDLAQSAGLKVPESNLEPAEKARLDAEREAHSRIGAVLEQAAGHYQERLRSSPQAIEYLKRRGLDGRTAKLFGLGYAPEGWRNLASAFASYDDPLLVEAGLVIVQGEDPAQARRYDRFRDRIMFPIRSVKGEVIGFGGRVLDAGEPKYLNSPETPVFVKGRELYGLYEARTAIRERQQALVVEGYMDVVALAQLGFGHAVATLGTACTADHVRKLLRFTDHVVFSFDGDAAGRRAAARALEAALPHVNDLRTFRFLFLPDEHDPDSYVRAFGAAGFEEQLRAAVPLSRQLVEQAALGCELDSAEGRARMVSQARPLWDALPDGAFRRQMLDGFAQAAKMPVEDLARLWGQSRPRSTAPEAPAGPARRPAVKGISARAAVRAPQDHVLHILLLHAGLWGELSQEDQNWLAELPGWHGQAARWLERTFANEGPLAWPALRALMAQEGFADPACRLVDASEVPPESDAPALGAAITRARSAAGRRDAWRVLGRA